MNINPSRHHKSNQAGFTLVELLAVVIIIGVLAAVAIPAYTHYTTKARTTEATTLLPQIRLRVETFRLELQTLPTATPNPGTTVYNSSLSKGNQGTWDRTRTDWNNLGFAPPTPGVYFQYYVNSNNAAGANPASDLTNASGNANSCHGLINGAAHYPPGSGNNWYTVCARGTFTGNSGPTNATMVFGMSGSPTVQRVFVNLKRKP